jgi:hypothetical protein
MYDEDLTDLDDGLRRLKVEYHIFFSGNRNKPPDDLRFRVEKLVKKLSECHKMSFSQRFRYNTLVTRYHVYKDLWRRMQQNHELGTDVKNIGSGSTSTRQSPTATSIRIAVSDPKAEDNKVRELYDALLQLKGADSQPIQLSYPQFAAYISAQTRSIREKYGCSAVAFTIALEEDAIRFTAVAENL